MDISIKTIKKLHEKKHRKEMGLFLVEGETSVSEVIKSPMEIMHVFCTKEFFGVHSSVFAKTRIPVTYLEADEITRVGTLEANRSAIAVVRQKSLDSVPSGEGIILALDDIRDPGNLGTILRIADWFGVSHIVASRETADFYNSKTIAASMGSFARVSFSYVDLPAFLESVKVPVMGAFLNGSDVHAFSFPKSGILVIGNESHGISESVARFVSNRITIPSYGGAESLNAGIATAVILDNWRRGP
ncbi:MAG: RNA methyltransferase [Candidatus Pacebacteria bacterium]|nr:RNA methyltransferase [Candidatus Paceibacterota bacterium]